MSYDYEEKLEIATSDLGLPITYRSEVENVINDLLEINYVRKFTPYGGFDALFVTSLYLATRNNGYYLDPSRLEEYVRESDDLGVTEYFDSNKIRESYKKICRDTNYDFKNITADAYLNYAKEALDLDAETVEYAEEIISKSRSEFGRSPVALASASVYIASYLTEDANNRLTQNDISSAFGVSTPTISYAKKDLVNTLTEFDVKDVSLKDAKLTATTLGLDNR